MWQSHTQHVQWKELAGAGCLPDGLLASGGEARPGPTWRPARALVAVRTGASASRAPPSFIAHKTCPYSNAVGGFAGGAALQRTRLHKACSAKRESEGLGTAAAGESISSALQI